MNKISSRKHMIDFKCRNKNILVLLILYTLCSAYKIVFSLFWGNPCLQTPQDMFSTLYSAAYFAGKDWSAIGREYSAYYGYGFVVLFSWLYRVFNDGLIIYRIILVCCHLVGMISCVLCYKIILLFEISNHKWITYFFAIACTSIQGALSCGIMNEYSLNVCVWAVLYILLKLCSFGEKEKNKKKYTIYLGILIIYACTVHARAIVLYILVGVCIILVKFIGKKMIVHIPTMVAMLFLIIPYKLFTNKMQILMLGELNSNSSVVAKASNGLKSSFSGDRINTFIMSIITYLHELSVISMGIFIICISAVIYIIYYALKKETAICVDKRQRDMLLCGLTYTLGGIAGFLLGICFSQRGEIYSGITRQISEFLRYLTLIRYFMPFVAPMVLLTIVVCVKILPDKLKKISACAMIIWIILQTVFVQAIYPQINFTGWANGVYLPFTWDLPMDKKDVYIVGGILIPFAFFLLCIWQIRKRKWLVLSILIILFTIDGMMYKYIHDIKTNKQFEMVDGGYKYFRERKEKTDIYVVIKSDVDVTSFYFLYQALLPNMRVIPGEPIDQTKGIYILTNDPETVTGAEQYRSIQLDDNEWLLTDI